MSRPRVRAGVLHCLYSNSKKFAELRRCYNKVCGRVMLHVARDEVGIVRKRGTEEHFVVGIREVLV